MDSMKTLASVAVALFLFALNGSAQDDIAKQIRQKYSNTLTELQLAKTPADLRKMVESTDAPEWVSIAPNGETINREEAIKSLEPVLSMPQNARPIPSQDFVYFATSGPNVFAVYWVYRKSENSIVGSLIRDTWAHGTEGWRRTRHEKIFPDRALSTNGNPVILPK